METAPDRAQAQADGTGRGTRNGTAAAHPAPSPLSLGWLLAALGCLVPLVVVWASGRTASWGDTARLYEPLRGLVTEALRAGRLPLWNPYEGTGVPLFAYLVHGVLHPVSLVTSRLGPSAGIDAMMAAHLSLGAAGTWALARRLSVSAAGAVAAAFAFGLSGYALSMTSNLVYLAGAGTAPWVVLAVRAAGGGGAGSIAAGALAVAAQVFTGEPQWLSVAAALGMALAAEASGRRGLLFGGASLLLGAALGAVQLVPAWAVLPTTIRGAFGIQPEERVHWALAPIRIVEMVLPGFFQGFPGDAVAPVYERLGRPQTGYSFFINYRFPFVPSVFMGAVPLALALAGLRRCRAARVLGVASLVLLWLALGHHAGAEQLLRPLPIWGSFRYAEKLVGPLSLCVALLAGMGVEVLSERKGGTSGWLVLCGGLLCGAIAVGLGSGLGEDALSSAGAGPVAGIVRWRLAVGGYHAATALVALGALVVAGSGVAAVRDRLGSLLAALVFATSLAAAPFAMRALPRDTVDRRPLAFLAAGPDPARICVPLESAPVPGVGAPGEGDPGMATDSAMGVVPYQVPSRIDQVDTYGASVPAWLNVAYQALGFDVAARRRYGMTHVVVRDLHGQAEAFRVLPALEGGTVVHRPEGKGFSVWAVPHRAWASFAVNVVATTTPAESYLALQAAGRDWTRTVVEGSIGGTSAGRVLEVERATEHARVLAEADGDALLVVNDALADGWSAFIDGTPVRMIRADLLVRAVPFPGGRHVLTMEYRAPGLAAGAWTSLAAAVVTLSLLGWALLRKRPARGSPIPRPDAGQPSGSG